jgi:hypothetical protein
VGLPLDDVIAKNPDLSPLVRQIDRELSHGVVRGTVAKWSGRCPDADREGGPQPCSPDLSGACEGLGDDHRIRVRTPEGEHPALAFA